MSLYSEFLDDSKEIVNDFGVTGSCNGGAITFMCMISDPVATQVFEAGGFCDRIQHTVRLPAVTASWSLPDGSNGASAALLSAGVPIASLGIGKKIVAGGKTVRINSQTFKPGSAWITLVVMDDSQ
jgi:hypothetical protein